LRWEAVGLCESGESRRSRKYYPATDLSISTKPRMMNDNGRRTVGPVSACNGGRAAKGIVAEPAPQSRTADLGGQTLTHLVRTRLRDRERGPGKSGPVKKFVGPCTLSGTTRLGKKNDLGSDPIPYGAVCLACAQPCRSQLERWMRNEPFVGITDEAPRVQPIRLRLHFGSRKTSPYLRMDILGAENAPRTLGISGRTTHKCNDRAESIRRQCDPSEL